MTSSSADIFNRLQLFRTGRSDDEQDSDPERPKPNPATSRVKRCLFGRGNSEENIKFAKRELEKSLTESKNKWYVSKSSHVFDNRLAHIKSGHQFNIEF